MTNLQILTIEQFAERMQISRSTAYSWVADGVLGTFLIRHRSVVRIIWSDKLLEHLQEISSQQPEVPKSVLRRKGTGGRNKIALDASYLEGSCRSGEGAV